MNVQKLNFSSFVRSHDNNEQRIRYFLQKKFVQIFSLIFLKLIFYLISVSITPNMNFDKMTEISDICSIHLFLSQLTNNY